MRKIVSICIAAVMIALPFTLVSISGRNNTTNAADMNTSVFSVNEDKEQSMKSVTEELDYRDIAKKLGLKITDENRKALITASAIAENYSETKIQEVLNIWSDLSDDEKTAIAYLYKLGFITSDELKGTAVNVEQLAALVNIIGPDVDITETSMTDTNATESAVYETGEGSVE